MNELDFKLLFEFNVYEIYTALDKHYTHYILNILNTLYYKRVERLNDLELIELTTLFYRQSHYAERKDALDRIVSYFINDELTSDLNEYQQVLEFEGYFTLYVSDFNIDGYKKLYVKLVDGDSYEQLINQEMFSDIMSLVTLANSTIDCWEFESYVEQIQMILEL